MKLPNWSRLSLIFLVTSLDFIYICKPWRKKKGHPNLQQLMKRLSCVSPVWVGMAEPALLPAPRPRLPARQERVRPPVPLARGLQHAARGPLEQVAADGSLAQARVQGGLWARSSAPAARLPRLRGRQGQEAAAGRHAWQPGRDLQVFSVQWPAHGKLLYLAQNLPFC